MSDEKICYSSLNGTRIIDFYIYYKFNNKEYLEFIPQHFWPAFPRIIRIGNKVYSIEELELISSQLEIISNSYFLLKNL